MGEDVRKVTIDQSVEQQPFLDGDKAFTPTLSTMTKAPPRQATGPFGLSRHQARLTVVSLLWVIAGFFMYTTRAWGKEQHEYSIIESLYVMVQIITTVGYGDYTPATVGGYLFTSVYVLTAVMVLSSMVSTVTEMVIRSEDTLIQNALGNVDLAEIKKKVSTRFTKTTSDLESACRSHGLDGPLSARGAGTAATGDAGTPATGDEVKPTESEVGFDPGKVVHPSTIGFFRGMMIWLLFVVMGTLFFHFCPGEDREFVEAMYMSVITLTTVGFGDMTPRTTCGQIFAVLWMLLGVAAFANMVAKFAAFSMAQDRIDHLDRRMLLEIAQDPFYRKCHPDEDPKKMKVSRADFTLFMLGQMGLLDENVVEHLSHNFDELDRDKSGFLDGEDISIFNDRLRRTLTGVREQQQL